MTLEPSLLNQIRKDWREARRGSKSAIVTRWADSIGISYSRLYAMLDTGRKRKKVMNPIIEKEAAIIALIKKRPPEHRGEICTEDAIKIAIANGAEITSSRSSIDRALRETGMTKRQRRVIRYQAERPNLLHHVDASTSACFYIARELPDGDRVLKMHAGTQHYKNKPVPIRERPWIYGLADDHSGYWIARYVAAEGESFLDTMDFLVWAWAKTDDKPFFGLPEFLKADHGPLMKSDDAARFLEKYGVAVDPSTPENKDAHGKIERPWRTAWQRFERPFFAEDIRSFEITLSELNRRFLNYQAEYNQKPHRFEKRFTRLQMWTKVNQAGGAIPIPIDAMKTAARRFERTVDAAGCFSLDNVMYEVKGLHSAKVWVHTGVIHDHLVVQDKKTRIRYEVEKFSPQGFCDFKGVKETPHQKAAKVSKEVAFHNILHDTDPELPKHVIAFPARVRATFEVCDTFDLQTYLSMDEAIGELTALCGFPIVDDTRDMVAEYILEHGMTRKTVRELAADMNEMMGMIEQEEAHG